jgi:hypothetical protein
MDLNSGECEGLQLSGLQADTSAFSACSEEFDDIPECLPGEVASVLQEAVPPGACTVSSRGSDPPCGAGMRNSSSSCEYVDYKQSSPSSEKSYQQSCASISEVHTLSDQVVDTTCTLFSAHHPGQCFSNIRDHENSNRSHPARGVQDEQQSQQSANVDTDSLRNAKAIRLSWLGKGSYKSSPAKKCPSKLKINLQAESSDESEGDAPDEGNDEVEMLSQLLLDPRKTQQAILKGQGGIIHVNPLVREALNLIIAR